jgi:toxin HigB-1
MFEDDDLERMFVDRAFAPKKYGPELIRAYRKAANLIRESTNQLELRNWKALRLEALDGNRQGQHSVRLWKGWRLILRFETDALGNYVAVIEMVDYHS